MTTAIHLILLIGVSFAVYYPARKGEFVFDDLSIQHNYWTLKGDWKRMWTRSKWRPLTWMSYALNVRWTGYHTEEERIERT